MFMVFNFFFDGFKDISFNFFGKANKKPGQMDVPVMKSK